MERSWKKLAATGGDSAAASRPLDPGLMRVMAAAVSGRDEPDLERIAQERRRLAS
jgi:hypothetical protein